MQRCRVALGTFVRHKSDGCRVWRLGFPSGKSGELLLIANYASLTLEEVADSGMQLMAMFFQQQRVGTPTNHRNLLGLGMSETLK